MMPSPYQAGDLIEWSDVDYVDTRPLLPSVGVAMEHVCKTELAALAHSYGLRVGEIFYSVTPVPGVAGAITYRAWSFVEGADNHMEPGYE